jgi:predicted ATP-grasp superfamily ATP-dependent carboligase
LGLDVTALLAEASPLYPDARAAALAVEALSDITGIEIPLNDLLEYARVIEDSVQQSLANAQPRLSAPDEIASQAEKDDDPSFM